MVTNPNGFRLGEFEVYPDRRTIVGPSGEMRLEPKVMAVLERLAQAPREVVTRAALLDEVWAGTVVTEEVLTRCISELRGAFGDRREEPRYIQTVPKSGYRLLVAPSALAQAQRSRTLAYGTLLAGIAALALLVLWWQDRAAVAAPQSPAIAILPFDDLSEPDAASYFAEGLAEELMQALARVPGLRIASRTSSFAYRSDAYDLRTIGEELSVTTVLDGSVRRADDRIRVTAQLTAVDSGYQLWADVFDREITDVFAIQNEIAAAIARALQLELANPGRFGDSLPDVEAYDLYLLGRHHWHRRTASSLARASELFSAAVELDPSFPLAYSGLADTHLFLTSYGDAELDAALAKAEPLVHKALELGPELAEPYASLGMLLTQRLDVVGAQRAYERALELNPHYSMARMWLANALASQGRLQDAHAHYLEAHRMDPLHPTIQHNLFWSFMARGEHDEAERLVNAALDEKLEPVADFTYMAAELALERGNYSRALRLAQECVSLAPEPGDALVLVAKVREALGQDALVEAALEQALALRSPSFKALAHVAERHAMSGDSAALEAHVSAHRTELENHEPWFEPMLAGWRGIAAVRGGRPEQAIPWLRQALDAAAGSMKLVKPDGRLTLIAHLILGLNATEQPERAAEWARRGRELIAALDREGLANGSYLVASGLLLAVAGSRTEAALRIDHALALGWSLPPLSDQDPLFAALDAATLSKLRLRQRETVERERARLRDDLAALPG